MTDDRRFDEEAIAVEAKTLRRVAADLLAQADALEADEARDDGERDVTSPGRSVS